MIRSVASVLALSVALSACTLAPKYERTALPVARHDANRDERQQERRGQLARAEGRCPDADQRRERLAHALGRAAIAAQLCVGAHGADERHADERSDHQEHDPPRARCQQLAPFLLQKPREGGFR